MTNTPAEKLAEDKRRNRHRPSTASKSQRVVWVCLIAELRARLNLTMRDVAHAVGLSAAAYFRIEKGYADVSLSNALKISQFFGKNICDLWIGWKGDL